ncbi:MAG: histidine phosphatase family protein [Burkholderiaceae bacterium]|nr:histidine phosphatase family protein [Microbacteriaceae bacterium]
MTTLVLVRHGETLWHGENRYAGSSDVGLTDRGAGQAGRLGGWAATAALDAVYSSDLSRAVITATPAASAAGTGLVIDPRLREVHFGRGEGMTRSEMHTAFPEALASFHAAPATSALPEGETGTAAIGRAWPALEEIAARHSGGRVLVVVHSTLMRLILCRVLDIPPDRYRSAFPGVLNGALTTISLGPGAPPALHGYNVPTG